MITENPPPRLVLKLQEVADRIGICARTIQRMVHRSEFPPPTVRAGKLPLWSVDVVQAWSRGEWRPESVQARKRRPTAAASR